MHITQDPHPLLLLRAFTTTLPRPLSGMPSPQALLELLRLDATAPLARDEQVRSDVRDLLRVGGYKPTGRGKPASEYLVRAAEEGGLRSINLVVDACNAVSLHSGLPISVVDTELARAPFRIGVAGEDVTYVFNASGQEIDVAGLLCLFDADGACANAVKDSQRTKTRDETRTTLSVIWGMNAHAPRLDHATAWYRKLLEECGAETEEVNIEVQSAA